MTNTTTSYADHVARFETRAAQEWTKLAGEKVTCELLGDTIYAFGSELACLRLFNKFYGSPNAKAAFSTNRNAWYFSKDSGL